MTSIFSLPIATIICVVVGKDESASDADNAIRAHLIFSRKATFNERVAARRRGVSASSTTKLQTSFVDREEIELDTHRGEVLEQCTSLTTGSLDVALDDVGEACA